MKTQKVALSSVAKIIMGTSPKGDTYNNTGNGLPLINGPTEFGDDHPDCTLFTTKSSKECNAGDLIFCVRGSTTGRMNWADKKYSLGRGVCSIRGNTQADTIYIRYCIEQSLNKLLQFASGATFPNLTKDTIVSFKIPYPNDRERIVDIVQKYDTLANTNRRRIQLLEESARLLFREWFVYFRFPRLRQGFGGQAGHEKACPVESINSTGVKIVDRGGRKMPAEWEYLPFTKIKLFKKAPLGVPVFTDIRQYCQTSEIDGTSITGNGEEVDYENRPSRADIAPRINTVYFAKMKDTDKVLYFNKGNSDLLEKILLSTGMVGFTTDEKYLGFLFGLLTSYEFVQYKNNFATGATQVSLNDASLKKIKVLLPTLNLVDLYSDIVNPLLEECSLLRSQNQKLAQARDLLLSRLMSGAIEV